MKLPVMAPIIDLRDTPTHTGRPSARSAPTATVSPPGRVTRDACPAAPGGKAGDDHREGGGHEGRGERDRGGPMSANAGLVMNLSTDIIQRVTRLNMDIHGPEGCMMNARVDKLVRDAMVWTHLAGDTVQRIKILKRLGLLFYELYGEKLVAAGHYQKAIRYREHMLPLAEAIRAKTERPDYCARSAS